VPHESYTRALRVLHLSEYKIVALRLSYINCLFILAFEIFFNTSFYLVLSSVCLRTGAINRRPYAYGMYAAIVYAQSIFIPRTRNIYPRTPTFTPRAPTVMRDCIYIIRGDGRDESVPYAYGMYADIVYVQSMFIPRVHNIFPNIIPRIVHAHQCFILVHPLWYVVAFIQFGVGIYLFH